MNNVTDLQGRRREQVAGSLSGGNGNGSDGRLRAVEAGLVRIETEIKHLATKSYVLWHTVIVVVTALASIIAHIAIRAI